MSSYLGFSPTEKPGYYFVSYNNEDSERVGKIAQFLSYGNLPIWYDYGLEYGEKWEQTISLKIKDAQAVLLFFTKGILSKENSYVKKEYQIATFFDKKVYVIMMDTITKADVPYDKAPWWIEIQERQTLSIVGMDDPEKDCNTILSALGMNSYEDKMSQLVFNYRKLYDDGHFEKAEAFLNEYLHGIDLRSKAELFAHLLNDPATKLTDLTKRVGKEIILENELYDHNNQLFNDFCETYSLQIEDQSFIIACFDVGHRIGGDPSVIHIWRNEKPTFCLAGLAEAWRLTIYYSKMDDILFIGYCSTNLTDKIDYRSVLTVENPCGEMICNDFRFLTKLSDN